VTLGPTYQMPGWIIPCQLQCGRSEACQASSPTKPPAGSSPASCSARRWLRSPSWLPPC